MARGTKHPIDGEMRWNFGDSRGTTLSLDEFLAQKEAAGVEFFAGKEPWLVGLDKLSWQTFFRVCTQFAVDQRTARVEQHLRTAFGPAHMLFLFHPPVHQLVDSRLHQRCRYAMTAMSRNEAKTR